MSKLYVQLSILCLFYISQVKSVGVSDKKKYLGPTELKCLDELGYDASIIQTGKETVLLEGDPKLNDYFFCVWENNGFLNDDGSVNFFKLQRNLEKKLEGSYNNYVGTKIADMTIRECRSVTGVNNKDTCVKLYNCLMKRMDEVIKLVEEEA